MSRLEGDRSNARSVLEVSVHRVGLLSTTVAVQAVELLRSVGCHSLEARPPMPAVHGRRFFLALKEEELHQAGPFDRAMDEHPAQNAWDVERHDDLEPGTDPARVFYLYLLPPLEDVLQRGFSLPAPLYPYQAEGVAFLAKRRHALLADDMGLGKTVQTIVALRVLLGSGAVKRALIVCPSGLKSNWRAELERWAPELAVHVLHGSAQSRADQWYHPAHVLIANYEIVRNDLEWLPQEPFDLVVLDEAQRIKNPETSTAQAVKAIPRRAAWCLTGTPIENSLSDLISILGFLKPDLRIPQDAEPEEARRRLAPYVLRRRKTDVLEDLPPKLHRTAYLELTQAQQEAYQAAEEQGLVYLQGLGETVTLQHVLALLTRLKQICNFDPQTGESAKLEYLLDSLEVIAEEGEKALIFSQYTETLEFLARHLSPFRPLQYHGGLSRKQKDEVLQLFRSEERHRVLLISLQAGGVGLNLQEACYVYHFDRWWNPAVERQAEDRAYRLGQQRPVIVTRLVMRNTIEERIHQILEEKEALFRRFMDDGGEGPAPQPTGLTDAEYFHLVGLDPALRRLRRTAS
ncbi:MAG: hypothetical protein KatS3mg115_2490 [Candidatus Poribacteria bacterium]|nr:MAG: hypothetical protein KatS3mg115_2490 [Candidatus Poribacteria bacterium]